MPPRDLTQRSALLHVVLQSERHSDCTIATLASYLGRSYEEVLVEAARVRRTVLSQGLHTTQMIAVAKRLGTKLRSISWEQVETEDATGILYVVARIHDQAYGDHVVIFRRGDILDCRDGTLWDSDVYFKHFAADAVTLLVEA